jgi:hypothetical protein
VSSPTAVLATVTTRWSSFRGCGASASPSRPHMRGDGARCWGPPSSRWQGPELHISDGAGLDAGRVQGGGGSVDRLPSTTRTAIRVG